MLVPTEIRNTGLIQVTGEVVAPKEIPNARNFAAGALGLKSLTEFSTRPLVFVAYDALPRQASHYEGSMTRLRMMGLREVTTFDCSRYPTDGVVYRLKDSVEFERLGHTSKHPRGAFALKEQAEGVETTLIDVVWQLGKSGVVSPVAILDPIEIGSATVSRATLHNIEYIRDLNLEIGCRVSVIRSGEIIPRIIGRVEK
jgi:DNA ligase (NAD+)